MEIDGQAAQSRYARSVSPLSIVSAPRSGSTLFQRLLASHPEIHSAPETWLAPTVLGGLSEQPQITALSRRWTKIALEETEARHPNLRAILFEAIEEALLAVFSEISPVGTRLFLRKPLATRSCFQSLFKLSPTYNSSSPGAVPWPSAPR